MFPYSDPWLVSIDTRVSAMFAYNASNWTGVPNAIAWSPSGGHFTSGVYTGEGQLYLIPSRCDSIVHFDSETGLGVGFNSWPLSFTPSWGVDRLFNGAIFDGAPWRSRSCRKCTAASFAVLLLRIRGLS